jgi:predicted transcriptional regulator
MGLADVMTHKRCQIMQRQINPIVPRHITDALDASLDNIAAGRLNDVDAVQAEARQMLAEHERSRLVASVKSRAKPTKVA